MVDTTDLKSVSVKSIGSTPLVGSRSGEIGRHTGLRIQLLKVQFLSSVMHHIRLDYFPVNQDYLHHSSFPLVTPSLLSQFYELSILKTFSFLPSLISILESRLDVVLVRSYLASNLHKSRQLISHQKIKLNGVISSYPGRILRPGDVIQANPAFLPYLDESLNPYIGIPSYLMVDYSIATVIFCSPTNLQEIFLPFSLE
jgi:hypothetical protein